MDKKLDKYGYEIINNIYSIEEIDAIIDYIDKMNIHNVFGLREFLIDNKTLLPLLFNKNLKSLISKISNDSFIIRSLYFDKPPKSNWMVNWHQDLTINLTQKTKGKNFKNWRKVENRVVVQPSKEILENIFTIRIHLDDCTQKNGALHIVKDSHKNGVIEISEWLKDKKGAVEICEIEKGGIMFMKPLLLHSSKRSDNSLPRRVIHIECCSLEKNKLPWKEKIDI